MLGELRASTRSFDEGLPGGQKKLRAFFVLGEAFANPISLGPKVPGTRRSRVFRA